MKTKRLLYSAGGLLFGAMTALAVEGEPDWVVKSGTTESTQLTVQRFDAGANKKGSHEMLEIHAKLPVNLMGGVVGDGKKMLSLPEDHVLDLKPGETVRIFVNTRYLIDDDKKFIVLSHGKDGIWKNEQGKTDRVLLKNKDGRDILDFTYEIVKKD